VKTPRNPAVETPGRGPGDEDGQGLEEILQRARDTNEGESRKERHLAFHRTRASLLEAPVLRVNKKIIRRKASTFNIILIIFGIGVGIVLYIGNIITVNHRAAETGSLNREYDSVMNVQSILLADVNQKSSWERIEGIATNHLGLQFPQNQGRWLILDEETLERVEEEQPGKP